MEIPSFISSAAQNSPQIKTIEMHTTGEPTRIVYSGYPDITYAFISAIPPVIFAFPLTE